MHEHITHKFKLSATFVWIDIKQLSLWGRKVSGKANCSFLSCILLCNETQAITCASSKGQGFRDEEAF